MDKEVLFMDQLDDYDFSCWVIKYNNRSIRGRTYQKNCLRDSGDSVVPLLWNHRHDDTSSILGQAFLENRDDGVFAYCKLHNKPDINRVIYDLILDTGSVSISPYINRIKYDKDTIVYGLIREVSLVLARIDPDYAYYPVLRQEVDI